MVSDNDLSVLGYVSDYICCLYGLRGAYGVVCVAQDSEVFARRGLQGIVGELLDRKDETGMKAEICSELGINQILKRNLMRGSQQLGVKYSSLLGRLMSVQSRRTREKQTIRAERAGEVQYFIGVQLDGSKHVEPLQNSIPEATVKENSKLVKETAENIDEAVRELPDANSCLQKSSMLLSYHNFKWPGHHFSLMFLKRIVLLYCDAKFQFIHYMYQHSFIVLNYSQGNGYNVGFGTCSGKIVSSFP
ncbi:uncharacterized protein LOC141659561 isoform X5 [Apium graveolens]|uniref:uncharacterized protein LOC141659561 isoform X5 n=1 Tax=Apium graveolens TaxID=4045 RepID=UPI003D79A172